MKFGVGVEGVSDRVFWNKVLHRAWPEITFDIRFMKNRNALISKTPLLLDQFRSAHYDGAIIILDRDRDPCFTGVFELFDEAVRYEAKLPPRERYLQIIIAVKGVESWYLADAEGVREAFPKCEFKSCQESAQLNPKIEFLKLLKIEYGDNTAYDKISLANQMSRWFNPDRAKNHSSSFRYFWRRLAESIERAS